MDIENIKIKQGKVLVRWHESQDKGEDGKKGGLEFSQKTFEVIKIAPNVSNFAKDFDVKVNDKVIIGNDYYISCNFKHNGYYYKIIDAGLIFMVVKES